ncbi:MAG: PIN domain-containing protein [Bacillota bacterium]|nr:PIN domain-containing protein [Bacillota bacterium]
MTAAIDTNILFDILLPDQKHLESSLNLLKKTGRNHSLIISEVVFGELASQFDDRAVLTDLLQSTGINLISSGPDALWEASRAWRDYTDNRTPELRCAGCGSREIITCPKCLETITCRQHIISDFLIGGHAFTLAGTLLTRDRGFYKRYFPHLQVLSSM